MKQPVTSVRFFLVIFIFFLFGSTQAATSATQHSTYTVSDIDVPGADYTYAFGINDAGKIVGWSSRKGFLFENGSFTNFSAPIPYSDIYPIGINSKNEIVGHYNNYPPHSRPALFVHHAFLLNHGVFTSVDYPNTSIYGTNYSHANGINESGAIVGSFTDDSGKQHAYLRKGGASSVIDFPGSAGATALAINSKGVVIGSYQDTAGGSVHGYLYINGAFKKIDDHPGAKNFVPAGINSAGDIVGTFTAGSASHVRVLLANGEFFTFDIPGNLSSGGKGPRGINVHRQVVGFYTDGAGRSHGFLATPIHRNKSPNADSLEGA